MLSKENLTLGKSLWILEDDPGLQFVYESSLTLRYSLTFFACLEDLKTGLRNKLRPDCDLIIADLRLPDGSFLDFMKSVEYSQIKSLPVLIVSSFDDLDIFRFCFNNGVADFLLKPFSKNALIVKVENIFQAKKSLFRPQIPDGVPLLDIEMLRIDGKQGEIELTIREMQILGHLLGSPQRKARRDGLCYRVWPNTVVTAKTLDVHLSNLRKKIERFGLSIEHEAPQTYQLRGPLEFKHLVTSP